MNTNKFIELLQNPSQEMLDEINKNKEINNKLHTKITCPRCGKEEYLHTCVHVSNLNLYYKCNYCPFEEYISQISIRSAD